MSDIKKWTQEELTYLREHMNTPSKELAETLGRTVNAINGRKSILRYRRLGDATLIRAEPEQLSEQEKILRLYKLAKTLRVRIQDIK